MDYIESLNKLHDYLMEDSPIELRCAVALTDRIFSYTNAHWLQHLMDRSWTDAWQSMFVRDSSAHAVPEVEEAFATVEDCVSFLYAIVPIWRSSAYGYTFGIRRGESENLDAISAFELFDSRIFGPVYEYTGNSELRKRFVEAANILGLGIDVDASPRWRTSFREPSFDERMHMTMLGSYHEIRYIAGADYVKSNNMEDYALAAMGCGITPEMRTKARKELVSIWTDTILEHEGPWSQDKLEDIVYFRMLIQSIGITPPNIMPAYDKESIDYEGVVAKFRATKQKVRHIQCVSTWQRRFEEIDDLKDKIEYLFGFADDRWKDGDRIAMLWALKPKERVYEMGIFGDAHGKPKLAGYGAQLLGATFDSEEFFDWGWQLLEHENPQSSEVIKKKLFDDIADIEAKEKIEAEAEKLLPKDLLANESETREAMVGILEDKDKNLLESLAELKDVMRDIEKQSKKS